MSRQRSHRTGMHLGARITSLVVMLLGGFVCAADAELMIIGNDEKQIFDEAGAVRLFAPGKDTVSIVDISAPEAPKIVASLPLENTIAGPPTNLAVTPDGRLAIVANSLHQVPDGTGWKGVPDNKLYVIDLTANPPSHIATVEIGKQPSGLAINRNGNLALVANRADNSISVLSIQEKGVTLKVDGTNVTETGKRLQLPGRPASMRGRLP